MPADLTVAQMKALHAAGTARLEIDRVGMLDVDRWMREVAGRNWKAHLVKALAEVSRELARATFTKGRT